MASTTAYTAAKAGNLLRVLAMVACYPLPVWIVQVVVRVRPVLPHEVSEPVAVSCSQDGRKVQV